MSYINHSLIYQFFSQPTISHISNFFRFCKMKSINIVSKHKFQDIRYHSSDKKTKIIPFFVGNYKIRIKTNVRNNTKYLIGSTDRYIWKVSSRERSKVPYREIISYGLVTKENQEGKPEVPHRESIPHKSEQIRLKGKITSDLLATGSLICGEGQHRGDSPVK